MQREKPTLSSTYSVLVTLTSVPAYLEYTTLSPLCPHMLTLTHVPGYSSSSLK